MNDPRTFEIACFGLGFEKNKGEQCTVAGHRESIRKQKIFGLVHKTKSKFSVNHKYKLCKLIEKHVCAE